MVIYMNDKYVGWIWGGLVVGYWMLVVRGNGYGCDERNLVGVMERGIFGEGDV